MAEKTFTVECTMEERWIPSFLSMLKKMERLGYIGSSDYVALYSDGDGDFRPVFKPNIDFETVDPKREDHGVIKYDAG